MPSRYLDLFERSSWTFVQCALAAWLVLDVDLWSVEALQVAAAAGAIAVAKSVVAFRVGAGGSAATLPEPKTGDAGLALIEWLVLATLVLVVLLILGVV